MAEGALALGAEASRVRRSALSVSPTAAGGAEEVTPACCHTAFISPSYRPPACASPMLMTPSLAMHEMTQSEMTQSLTMHVMTQSLAMHVMTPSLAMHEMTQSLAMHEMTQSLAMHETTMGQSLCGHQVNRQHQDLCTEHAFAWQMGRQSQA